VVLSGDHDDEVDPVIIELGRRSVEVVRYDVAYFPLSSVITATHAGKGWTGSLSAYDRIVDLTRVRSIWHRRPTTFRFDDAMPLKQRRFAFQEARSGLAGTLYALPGVTWVNHPQAEATAQFKPLQLDVASACGFRTPRTLISNDPDAVRRFYDECGGQIVYKTLSHPHLIADAHLPSPPSSRASSSRATWRAWNV